MKAMHGGHAHHPGGFDPDHAHDPADFGRAFAIGTALNVGYVAVELGLGHIAHSLALYADAAHNASDVLGLLLAWAAAWFARKPPTDAHTYGYRRGSILAALANATLLLVAVGGIVVEALQRLVAPQPVESALVMAAAAAGIVVNAATALLFMRGRRHDLNIRGAFLHMAADAGVSLGVVVAAALIMLSGWLWLDPAISLVVAVVILVSSWRMTRESFDLALDAVPPGIDRDAVEHYLGDLPGVASVHDLHIWAMSTTETALTAHLVRPQAGADDALLAQTAHALADRFGIGHVTLQIETGDGCRCPLLPERAV